MMGGFISLLIFNKNVDVSDKKIAIIDHTGLISKEIISSADWRNKNQIYDKETGKKNKPAIYN